MKQLLPSFTLEAFAKWLEPMEGTRTFNFNSTGDCLYAQFLKHLGYRYISCGYANKFDGNFDAGSCSWDTERYDYPEWASKLEDMFLSVVQELDEDTRQISFQVVKNCLTKLS